MDRAPLIKFRSQFRCNKKKQIEGFSQPNSVPNPFSHSALFALFAMSVQGTGPHAGRKHMEGPCHRRKSPTFALMALAVDVKVTAVLFVTVYESSGTVGWIRRPVSAQDIRPAIAWVRVGAVWSVHTQSFWIICKNTRNPAFIENRFQKKIK